MAKISNPTVMGKQWKRLRKVFTGHREAIWWQQHKAPLLRGLLLGSGPQAYLSAVWKPQELISAQRVGGMLQQQREKFFLCCAIGWPACSCLKMLGREVVGFKFGFPGGCSFVWSLKQCLVRCISRKPHRLWPLLSWRLSTASPPVFILAPWLSNTEFLWHRSTIFYLTLSLPLCYLISPNREMPFVSKPRKPLLKGVWDWWEGSAIESIALTRDRSSTSSTCVR